MRSFLPPLLLLAIACSPASGTTGTTASAQNEQMETPRAAAPQPVQLEAKPTAVSVPLGIPRADALAIARDPNRTLVLRIEGISVAGQPGVYEVSVGGQAVGVLSFYGVARTEGEAVTVFPIDDAVARVAEGNDELTVVFTPKGRIEDGREVVAPEGRASFKRLRVVEEKLPQ